MTAPAPDPVAPQPAELEHLVELLRHDDVDAALEAGLMGDWPDSCADSLDPDARRLLLATRARLRSGWRARERYRARNARLARRAAEREAARRPATSPAVTPGTPPRPALPANAAALLARARARASGGQA